MKFKTEEGQEAYEDGLKKLEEGVQILKSNQAKKLADATFLELMQGYLLIETFKMVQHREMITHATLIDGVVIQEQLAYKTKGLAN